MSKLSIALLLISSASAQDVERQFRLPNTQTTRGQQEIATSLRTVGMIDKLSLDPSGLVTVNGSAPQIALAEWLVPRLDLAPPSHQSFKIPGSDDIAEVYPLSSTTNNIALQEIITSIRTVVSLQRIYNISAKPMVVMRGTANEIEATNFLIGEFDRAPQPRTTPYIRHFSVTGALRGYDTLSIYGVVRANTADTLQMIITSLRTVTDTQFIYNKSDSHMLAMRASAQDTQLNEWLISELDREAPNDGANQMQMPGGKDDLVRVVYLNHLTQSKDIGSLITSIRKQTEIKKIYFGFTPPAIVVRGTADYVAQAGRMIAQADQPAQ